MQNNQGFLQLLPIAFSVTAPIFLLIILGAYLNHIKFITQEFIRVSSKLIFTIGLPVMLFTSTATHDFNKLINVTHLALILVTTFMVYIISHYSEWN